MNLVKHNWCYLFGMNFISVFNSNFLKHCIIFISITWDLPECMTRSQLIAAESAALVLPYLVLSPMAGKWSKREYKLRILRWMKAAELGIVGLASVAFYLEDVWLALGATLLMGVQACLYSPAKYGLIHDVDGNKGAAFGSGMFEAMAFGGILIGTVVASLMADHYSIGMVTAILVTLAIIGYGAAKGIKVIEQETEDEEYPMSPVRYVVWCHRIAREHKGLNKAIFGASFFWFVGSMLQMNIVLHTTHTMSMSNTLSGVILALAATGIAVGCFVAGKLVDKFDNPQKLKNIGLTGLTVGSVLLGIGVESVIVTGVIITLTAAFGGLFQVPCLTTIQRAPLGRDFSVVMAYTNMMTFAFVLVSSGIFSLITLATDENSNTVFLSIGVICGLCMLTGVVKDN